MINTALAPSKSNGPVELFYSYSHADSSLRLQLEKHLSSLKQPGIIKNWHDRQIIAGQDWEHEIDVHIESAKVILFLVSSDFISSDYCTEKEVIRAMERHQKGDAIVIPVILRESHWQVTPFGKLQALPSNGKPVTSWANRDAAFKDIVQGIEKAVSELDRFIKEPINPSTNESPTLEWIFVMTATFEEVDRPIAEALIQHLEELAKKSKITKYKMALKEIGRGSVKLTIESSEEAYELMKYLFETNQLVEVNGFKIQSIYRKIRTVLNRKDLDSRHIKYNQATFFRGKRILITGGAGFIGSHVVRLFVEKYPEYHIYNLDALTYAGNLINLIDIEHARNYTFIKGDITDSTFLEDLFADLSFDGVIHLASDSQPSIPSVDPMAFVMTNVVGTVNLLNAAKKSWASTGGFEGKRFYHISTYEVFGSLYNPESFFSEVTGYDPQSPYSASKAASDHFVWAYGNTYKLPVIISNSSNNYGPNQFPEKLIPQMINNIMTNQPLPINGKGEKICDWLFVVDHAHAIDAVFHKGKTGETYNIGGYNEWKIIDLVHLLCQIMDRKLGRPEGTSAQLITYVTDHAENNLRYTIDAHKITAELGWLPSLQFAEGLERTVDWFLTNQPWLQYVVSGNYKNYYLQAGMNRAF